VARTLLDEDRLLRYTSYSTVARRRRPFRPQAGTHPPTINLRHAVTMSSHYPLWAKFVSELLGMTLTIWMGESVLANELLPNTKGHAMGLLAVALAFGLAFGMSIAWFGAISAHLNPAMLLFLAVLGKLQDGWIEFVALSVAEVIGAFLGACLVYLQFAQHFNTVPLPEDDVAQHPNAALLHGFPDALATDAARIASAFGQQSRRPSGLTLRKELRKLISFDAFGSTKKRSQNRRKNNKKDELLLQRMEVEWRQRKLTSLDDDLSSYCKPAQQRRSIQVAGILHKHDAPIITGHNNNYSSSIGTGDIPSPSYDQQLQHAQSQPAPSLFFRSNDDNEKDSGNSSDNRPAPVAGSDCDFTLSSDPPNGRRGPDLEGEGDENGCGSSSSAQKEEQFLQPPSSEVAALEAAIRADTRAKLSVFCTRPAKYNPFANFYQEMTATAALVAGAELLNLRSEYEVDPALAADGPFVRAIFVSLFITMLILGLGGTTGLAVNPARDFGPRLAHYLVLPIPSKGSSEWNYGWLPASAPFAGAALGAGLYALVELLYASSSSSTRG